MLIPLDSETVCKDTTNIPKLSVLENFSVVKKCQTADFQHVKNKKRKLSLQFPL